MSWLSNLFNPGGGYNKAEQQLGDYYNQGQQKLDPYNQNGMESGNQLMEFLKKLSNPGELQNEWSQGYETSPYAQQAMGQAKESGLDAASSMGLMGSSSALNNIQNQSSNIMQKDRQQYMDDLMQKYMSGIGLGENMYGAGANAANQQSQNANKFGENMAGLEFGKYNAGPNMITGGIGAIMKFIESMMNKAPVPGVGGK